MPWKILEQNGKFCVVKKDDGKLVKCHPTREKAKSHLTALYVNEPSAAKKSMGYGLLKSAIEERVVEIKACGANKPGGGGFSAGNTCARGGGGGSGSAESYGLEKKPHFAGETLSINGVSKKAEAYDVKYGGEKIGSIHNYRDYKETKVAGQRYVTSRKDVVKWSATVDEGFHQVKWHPADASVKSGSHTEMGLSSKQAALEMVQRLHRKP